MRLERAVSPMSLYGEIDVRILFPAYEPAFGGNLRDNIDACICTRSTEGIAMRRIFVTAVVSVFAAVLAPAALAATATPFGGATVNDGILTLVSNTGDAGSTNDASGATFSDTGVTTFSSITQLSAEFNVTDDDCVSGSPRFQIRVDTPSVVEDKNVFVYLDPTPTASGGCAVNTWLSTGNLIGSTTNGQYDTSQIQPGGTQVSTYAQALALVGTYPVTSISLVVDSGGASTDNEQTVMVRNVRVNTRPSTPARRHHRRTVVSTWRRPARSCAPTWVRRPGSGTARTRTAPTPMASVSRRWPA